VIKNSVELSPVSSDFVSLNKNIGYKYDWKKLTLLMSVKNNWNVTQSVIISGMLYNALWFQKDFNFWSKSVTPGSSIVFDVDLWIIPFYKWFFSVLANLDSTPIYEFDTSSLNKKMLEHTVLQETWTFFIFSWIWIGIILLVIWIIVKLFWPKKKNV
jgi:hypothetical protein